MGGSSIVACPKAAHSGDWFFHRRIALEKFLFLFLTNGFCSFARQGDLYDGQPISRHARLPRKGTRYDVADCGCLREFHAFRTQEGRKHKRGKDWARASRA